MRMFYIDIISMWIIMVDHSQRIKKLWKIILLTATAPAHLMNNIIVFTINKVRACLS